MQTLKKRLPTNENGNENGVVFFLLCLLVPVIMLCVALVVDLGYHALIQQELKTATNAAAHAGAISLSQPYTTTGGGCPSKACWEEARKVALRVLGEHQVHGGEERDLDLTRDQAFYNNSNCYSFRPASKNVTIKVERGLWGRFDGTEKFSFKSLDRPLSTESEEEGAEMSCPESEKRLDNGGGFLIANAVKVSVTRPQTRYFIARYFGFSEASLETSSVAAFISGSSERVAPFALAPCTLLKGEDTTNSSIYSANDLSGTDRIFIQDDPRTLKPAIPSFLYRVEPAGTPDLPLCTEKLCIGDQGRNHEYKNLRGVVGEPGKKDTSKEKIRDYLTLSADLQSASIGEPFAPLKEGFEEYDIFGDILVEDIFQTVYSYSSVFNSKPGIFEEKFTCAGVDFGRIGGICPGMRANPNKGLNSFLDPHYPWYFQERCDEDNLQRPPTRDLLAEGGVWQVRIPLIETLDQKRLISCDSYTSRSAEEWKWTIVGFITVNLFDFALNEPNLLLPDTPCTYVRGRISSNDLFFADAMNMTPTTRYDTILVQ